MHAHAVQLGEGEEFLGTRFAISAFDRHEGGTGDLNCLGGMFLRESCCGTRHAEPLTNPCLFCRSHESPWNVRLWIQLASGSCARKSRHSLRKLRISAPRLIRVSSTGRSSDAASSWISAVCCSTRSAIPANSSMFATAQRA